MKNIELLNCGRRRFAGSISLGASLLLGASPLFAQESEEDDIIELSPFEVRADEEGTYTSNNTNAITGTDTALEDLPLDAQVFNQTIMEEMGHTDVMSMMSELGGFGTGLLGGGEEQTGYEDGDRQDWKSMTSRGLAISNPRRDGFLRSETSLMDNFDLASAQAIEGSNSLLFGTGDAGGVINVSGKRATLGANSTKISLGFDTEGSTRYTLDTNHAIGETFALRYNGMYSDKRYYRPHIYRQQEGHHLTATWRPHPRLMLTLEAKEFNNNMAVARTSNLQVTQYEIAGDAVMIPKFTKNSVDFDKNAMVLAVPVTLREEFAADNKPIKRIVANPELNFWGDDFTITNQDTWRGGTFHNDYENEMHGATLEYRAAERLHFQLRYSDDRRENSAQKMITTSVYEPGYVAYGTVNEALENGTKSAKGFAYILADETGAPTINNQNPFGDYATYNRPQANPFRTGAHGHRFTTTWGFGNTDSRWGDHRVTASVQSMKSYTENQAGYFYEIDENGDWVFKDGIDFDSTTDRNSGRKEVSNAWFPANLSQIPVDFDGDYVTEDGRTFRYGDRNIIGGTMATDENPLGLTGWLWTAAQAASQPDSRTAGALRDNGWAGYYIDRTTEDAQIINTVSRFLDNKVKVLAGLRTEEITRNRVVRLEQQGPRDVETLTLGTVIKTPLSNIDGIKKWDLYYNYATNAKSTFSAEDIFNTRVPFGEGKTNEIGFKYSLARRISGNINYFRTTASNFTGNLSDLQRNQLDPNGINGRNGGKQYAFSKNSSGYGITLNARLSDSWEMRLNYANQDGTELSDVSYPTLYNDQFNTMTFEGETVVAEMLEDGTLIPHMGVANWEKRNDVDFVPEFEVVTVDSLRPGSDHDFEQDLDEDSGRLLDTNGAAQLREGDYNTGQIGTGITGLPITDHQLGWVHPGNGGYIVRSAGTDTTGYAEHDISLINRYAIREGKLKGLVFSLSTNFKDGRRGYYYTDKTGSQVLGDPDYNAGYGSRKLHYFKDRFSNNLMVKYAFRTKERGVKITTQLNIYNLFNNREIEPLVRAANGELNQLRYQLSPRYANLTTSFEF